MKELWKLLGLTGEPTEGDAIAAVNKLKTDLKCVIVGDAPYAEEYIRGLRQLAEGDPRIVFTGYVFGRGYAELGSNARIFVETSGVGGTHPALVEAMAFGACVVAHNTPENLETIGDAGLWYDSKQGSESLRAVLAELLVAPAKVQDYAARAQARAASTYNWEVVTDAYEALFQQLVARD